MEPSAAVVQALLIILFVGGLSLLAQWGRKNRRAESALIIFLLFSSILVVTLGVTVALVGLSGADTTLGSPPELSASATAVVTLAGLAGLALCVLPLRKVAGRRNAAGRGAAPDSDGSSGTGRPSESRFFAIQWSDPPTFFGLWMFVVVLASNVVGLLIFALKPDAVASALVAAGRISPFAIFVSQVPFVVIALLGVGLGVRRNFRRTLARLGHTPPVGRRCERRPQRQSQARQRGAPLSVGIAPWTEARRVSEEDVARLMTLRGTQVVRDARGQPFALFESSYSREDAEKALGKERLPRPIGRSRDSLDGGRDRTRRPLRV